MHTFRIHYWNDDVMSFAFYKADDKDEAMLLFFLDHGAEQIISVTKI